MMPKKSAFCQFISSQKEACSIVTKSTEKEHLYFFARIQNAIKMVEGAGERVMRKKERKTDRKKPLRKE